MLEYTSIRYAGVAELADAQDSKSCEVTFVWVRPPPPAPNSHKLLDFIYDVTYN